MKAIKQLLEEGRQSDALAAIHAAARLTDDYSTYTKLCRLRSKLTAGLPEGQGSKPVRLAILGGATTDFLNQPLSLELETLGIESEIFSSDYNTYVAEMMDPGSEAAAFNPDVTLLALTPFNVADWPEAGDSVETATTLANKVCSHWLGLSESFYANTGSEIIITNMHMLPVRPYGNLGSKLPWDRNSFLRRVNACLSEAAPQYVHILDIDTLSATYGISNWFDSRFWYMSKQPVAFDCIVPYVRNIAAIVAGIYGRSCKCVVLDLDNTMWGGVVGDDGVDGIRIGDGNAESEAFKAFQEYLRELKNRGILLAVCSKNEEANALAPFEELTDMVLARDDFVAFHANWEPKPGNLQAIARALNIGLDALLFVDDNPAEREHVRQVLPMVKVLELTDDPADYPVLLDRCGWLEPVRLSDEDRNKTRQYQENSQRSELEATSTDYDGYLQSLEQQAEIRPFEAVHLDRITQLINKTNQFNLTTGRQTRPEVEALMNDDSAFTASLRLADRFGDNGIVSVLSGRIEGKVLELEQWLMSCRVFKRGAEFLLANYVFEQATAAGVETVRGTYIPTTKNSIVREHYAALGFSEIANDDGTTRWEIRVADYVPANVHIALQGDQ